MINIGDVCFGVRKIDIGLICVHVRKIDIGLICTCFEVKKLDIIPVCIRVKNVRICLIYTQVFKYPFERWDFCEGLIHLHRKLCILIPAGMVDD